jgi:hypothetical protein
MMLALTTAGRFEARAQDPPSLEVLQAVARVLNKQTPMMVDTDTELSSVAAEAGAIVYHYRLLRVTASAIPVDRLKAFAQPAVTEKVCGNPGTRRDLLDRGVVMRCIYVTQGRPVRAVVRCHGSRLRTVLGEEGRRMTPWHRPLPRVRCRGAAMFPPLGLTS